MKLWKKLAFTGVSALLVSTLAAYGGSGFKGQIEADDPDTLQMYQIGDRPDNSDQLVGVANKRIEREIGAKVGISHTGWGDYEKKMNVTTSSGENYDIAFTNNYVSSAQKGVFTDLTKLVPKYAEKAYNDLDEAYIKGNLMNGKLYAFPVNGNVFIQQALTFNRALLDKYDLSIDGIQSYADAEKVLKEFHEKEPNTAAFAIGQELKVQGNFDYPLGSTLPFAIDLDGDDSKIINQYDNGTYTSLLRMMHSWCRQGLIPGDAATSNKDYPLEGNTRLMREETQGPYDYGDTILTNAAEQELISKAITVPLKSTIRAQVANFIVSSTSKNKEKSVELLRLLNSGPELLNGLAWGIEGGVWEKVDGSEGKVELLGGYQPDIHMPAWNTGNSKILYAQESIMDDMIAKRDQSITEAGTSPILEFGFNTDSVKAELSNISNVMNQYLGGLNTGTVDPDETLPRLKEALDKAGYDKVLKEI